MAQYAAPPLPPPPLTGGMRSESRLQAGHQQRIGCTVTRRRARRLLPPALPGGPLGRAGGVGSQRAWRRKRVARHKRAPGVGGGGRWVGMGGHTGGLRVTPVAMAAGRAGGRSCRGGGRAGGNAPTQPDGREGFISSALPPPPTLSTTPTPTTRHPGRLWAEPLAQSPSAWQKAVTHRSRPVNPPRVAEGGGGNRQRGWRCGGEALGPPSCNPARPRAVSGRRGGGSPTGPHWGHRRGTSTAVTWTRASQSEARDVDRVA